MSLFNELKRRNVLRVGAAYVVVAWLAIQIVETIFPAFGFTDAAIRITTIVFGIGLIPTMIFAWAFELTPEGLKKESEVDRSGSITPHTGKKLDRMIMVVLALALAYFAFDKFVLSESREATLVEEARQEGRSEALVESYGDKSIAVLPFVNMSSDPDQEYMSDGIAEELLNLLAKVPELRVTSRSTAFTFKGKENPISDIGKILNVAHILEGSVRKSGNRIRITAQLIDTRTDAHLWSETYDRDLADIFAIQDEVAAAVVDELKVKLLGEPLKVRETNPAAYDLYLKAAYQIGWVNTEDSHEKAIDLLEQALAIDEHYAPAWSALNAAYLNSARIGFDFISREEAIAKSREAAAMAYKLDPENALAVSDIGLDKLFHENDLQGAAEYLSRALELDPIDWRVHQSAAILLRALGRYEEAVRVQEYILETEPLNLINQDSLLYSYGKAGHYQQVLEMLEERLKLEPDNAHLLSKVAWAKINLRDGKGALEYVSNVQAPEARLWIKTASGALEYVSNVQTPEAVLWIKTAAYHLLGDMQMFENTLTELQELAKNIPDFNWVMAELYCFLGDADKMFTLLERAYEKGNLHLMYSNPDYREYYDDPRWIDLLNRLGTSKETFDAIKFEVNIPTD